MRGRGGGRRAGGAALALLCLWAAPACAPGDAAAAEASGVEGAGAVDVADDAAPRALPARFTVRGRRADPRGLRYRVEPGGGPVAPAAFAAAVARACAAWSDTGVVALRPAREGEEADVVLAWRRGAHEGCPPFGVGPDVAHTGPLGRPTFVHLDAGRAWDAEAGSRGARESLEQVALHELGHALGLGHSEDPAAQMHPDARVAALGASDLAGLASLYGGSMEDAPSDLVVLRRGADGEERRLPLALRRVAPAATTAFALFDLDGDGADEALVWRTDEAGLGTLTAFRFDAGPLLARTAGPWLGAVPSGATPRLVVTAAGARLLVTEGAQGPARVRRFAGDELARLEPLARHALEAELPTLAPAPVARGDETLAGDLDGDGLVELVRRAR